MMIDDKELIRRALLGSREAQQECTGKRIALPCPFCGNKNIRISNWGMWRCWCPECLGKSEDSLRERDAIKHWNTRSAPPIGRCGECKHRKSSEFCECRPRDTYCSDFEPEEGAECREEIELKEMER